MRIAFIGTLLVAYSVIFWFGPAPVSGIAFVAFFTFILSVILFSVYLHIASRVDTTIVFYVFFTIFIALGSLFFSRFPDFLLHRISSGHRLSYNLDKYALYMALGILIFLISALFLRLHSNTIQTTRSVSHNTNYKPIANLAFISIYMICVLGLVLEPGYFNSLPQLFLGELTGGALRKGITLSDTASSYPGKSLVLILKYQILPAISLIMLCLYRGKKGMCWAIAVFTLIMLFSEFRRGPALQFLLCMMFLSVLAGRKFNTSRIVIMCASILAVYIGSTFALGRSQDVPFGEVAFELVWRVMFSQSQTGTYVFQLFPDIVSFADGGSYLSALPTIVTGTNSRPLSVQVFYYIHDRQGGASFTTFAEAYANFAFLGVFLVAIFLPVFFAIQENLFLINTQNLLEQAIFAFFLFYIVTGITLGSLVGPLINLILVRFLVVLIYFFTHSSQTKPDGYMVNREVLR